jgi:hypothetical protein
MQRGRNIHLAALAGAFALAAGAVKPAHGAATPITTPSAPLLTPADGRVLVSFGGVLNAVGYNVYSHSDPTAAPVLVNAQPTPYTWLIDDGGGKGLKNGTPLLYSVKAVIPDASGKPAEGPASPEAATTPNPPLFGSLVTYNIGTLNPGSATYDATKKVINIRSSGGDLWDNDDSQTFIAMPVDGDFTITATLPADPTLEAGATQTSAKIGLEMREGLEPGAPYAYEFASVKRDPEIRLEVRRVPFGDGSSSDNYPDDQSVGATNFADFKFPVVMRLIRSGTMISAQESHDGGTTWIDEGSAQDFSQLGATTYVGIGATAEDDGKYVDGQLTNLSITSP